MGTRSKNRKAGIFAATILLALLTGPAYSQENPDSKVVIDPDTLYQNRELDRRYHEILNRQPDGKEAHDPWGSVRASETKPKDDKNIRRRGRSRSFPKRPPAGSFVDFFQYEPVPRSPGVPPPCEPPLPDFFGAEFVVFFLALAVPS